MLALSGAGPIWSPGPGFKKLSPSPGFVNVELKYMPNAWMQTDLLVTAFNGAMGTPFTLSRELFTTAGISTV
jgi:hypothetical protein